MSVTLKDERFVTPACGECGFSSRDLSLLENHNCETERNGGVCEDYPCCGHERGDCNGRKYGSDAQIKADVERAYYDEDFAYLMERQAEYDEVWG